jgi:hypothetical protein
MLNWGSALLILGLVAVVSDKSAQASEALGA